MIEPWQDQNGGWLGPAKAYAPAQTLTVSDVERLAKAGVAIKFEDIRHQVAPDPAPVITENQWPNSLVESFWQRWRRANPQRYDQFDVSPFAIYASEHGDKVYVFVAPNDQPPFIIEDTRGLYPSDALMAALMLHEQTK